MEILEEVLRFAEQIMRYARAIEASPIPAAPSMYVCTRVHKTSCHQAKCQAPSLYMVQAMLHRPIAQ